MELHNNNPAWKPISTAPRDHDAEEQEMILLANSISYPKAYRWDGECWVDENDEEWDGYYEPTHWMHVEMAPNLGAPVVYHPTRPKEDQEPAVRVGKYEVRTFKF